MKHLSSRAKSRDLFKAIFLSLLFLSCETEVTYKKGNTIYVYPNHVNDDRKNITKKTCRILDFDNGEKETEKIDAYFLNDTDKKNLIPYVELYEMVGDNLNLAGLPVLDLNENTATYYVTDSIGYSQKYILNWKENTITLTSPTSYIAYLSFSAVNQKQVQYLPSYEKTGGEAVYKIGDYGFDILFYRGKALIPFAIINSFFSCGFVRPLMYNGIDFCVMDDPNNLCFGYESDKDKARRFYGNNFKKECPEYLRIASYNTLKFHFENFYALKNFYGEDFINQKLEGFKEEILSTDPKTYTNGILKFLFSFKDLHTGISSYLSLFYDEKFNGFKEDDENWGTINGFFDIIDGMNGYKYGNGNYYENDVYGATPLKYSTSGETLLINIDNFIANDDESVYDLSDGWKNSNYAAIRMAIEDAKQKGGVKNIVIDLSTSLGGHVSAELKVLGFMTKEPMYAVYDAVENLYETCKFKVDTNCDGKFDDDDGYTEYNWYILTSPMSFSGGSIVPLVAQFNGYAKIIGQKTAGGHCAKSEVFLPDGLLYNCSMRKTLCGARYVQNGNKVDLEYSDYKKAEKGVEPDIKIDTMDEAFYQDLANNIEKEIKKYEN